MKRERLNFKCWNCNETFENTVDTEGEPRALLMCYYCSAECIYDFNLYRDTQTEVLRSGKAGLAREEISLPEVIDTIEPTEGDNK